MTEETALIKPAFHTVIDTRKLVDRKEPFTVSYSKLKKYLECPKQYQGLYVLEGKAKAEQESAPIMDSGKIVHRVLELIGTKRMRSSDPGRKVKKQELLDLLLLVAAEKPTMEWHKPVQITPEVMETAHGVLTNCHKALNFTHTIETEKFFDVPIGAIDDNEGNVLIDNAWVTGIIDRIDMLPSGRIKIIDYKTGYSLMSRAEAELDPQINLYLLIGSILYPGQPVELELRFIVRNAKLGPFYFSEARKEWTLAYLRANIARMVNWTQYPETPGSPQCYSCHRRFACVSFAKMLTGSLAPVGANMGQNLALHERLSDIKNNAERLLKTLNPVINSACENADDGEFFAGDHKARLSFRKQGQYKDLRRTSIEGARAVLATREQSKLLETVVPVDQTELTKAYADLVSKHAELQKTSLEVATAFEIACRIAKAQKGLVDEFVDKLPPEAVATVGLAMEVTETDGGHFMLDVERIPIPFYDPKPSLLEVEQANKQADQQKLLTDSSRPILDGSHEPVVATAVKIAEPEVKAELKPAETPVVAVQTSMFPDKPAATTKSVCADEPVPELIEPKEQEATWAQPNCKACGGTGYSSKGGRCNPCVNKASVKVTT